jgi:hypothetical protein
MRILTFLFVVSAFLVQPAAAQPAQTTATPEALSAVYQCASVTGDAERLACFDSAVGRLRQAEQQGQVVAVDRQQVAELERDSFGFSLPSLSRFIPQLGGGERSEPIENLEMTVERIAMNSAGRARFVMSNGQTWTQTEPQRTRNVREGDTVTVRRAAMGSFMLSGTRGGAAHRVRREN